MKNILLVDDSTFDRTLLKAALSKKMKINILQAKNGDECLQYLYSEKIDLILLDIMMPDLKGDEILKKIREKFNAIELPVIMVTSLSEQSDIISFLQNGANDYITKPVTFDVAVTRIQTHLHLSELSRNMGKLKEIASINAMVSTYNHEINNPLMIAISCADYKDLTDPDIKKRLSESLWRIADIVKKIQVVTEKEIEFEEYTHNSKMIQLK